jgi:hypothetical protein
VPLSLHHLPLPITFAAFEGGDLLAVDPSLKEEAAAAGSFTGALRCCLLACMECVYVCCSDAEHTHAQVLVVTTQPNATVPQICTRPDKVTCCANQVRRSRPLTPLLHPMPCSCPECFWGAVRPAKD